MENLLSQLGADLATLVQTENRPTTELDIDKPRMYGYRFLDSLLSNLCSPMNSKFFVGDDIEYLEQYVNSLALLMNQPENLLLPVLQTISERESQRLPEMDPEAPMRSFKKRFIGKRLYLLSIQKMLDLSNNDYDKWHEMFEQVVEYGKQESYFYVSYDLYQLFNKENKDRYLRQASDFFWATRERARLTFIAPVNWVNYVNHIENGIYMLIYARRPILFTPRPPNLPA
jgi:hypothetical protein